MLLEWYSTELNCPTVIELHDKIAEVSKKFNLNPPDTTKIWIVYQLVVHYSILTASRSADCPDNIKNICFELLDYIGNNEPSVEGFKVKIKELSELYKEDAVIIAELIYSLFNILSTYTFLHKSPPNSK